MHKLLALTLAVGYTLAITILSLISLSGVPKLGSTFDDKIYHFGAYLIFVVVWYNFFRAINSRFRILYSAGIAFIYGIIVEVLQGTFTTYRTEDVADVFANSIGVIVAALALFLFRKIKLK